eukprot:12431470-Karenia_brevis.AAC.1
MGPGPAQVVGLDPPEPPSPQGGGGLDGPKSFSLNPKTGALVICDTGNRRVVQYDAGATRGKVIAGTGAAVNSNIQIIDQCKICMDFDHDCLYLTGYTDIASSKCIFKVSDGACNLLVRLPAGRPGHQRIRHMVLTSDQKVYVLHEHGRCISVIRNIDGDPSCVELVSNLPAGCSRLAIACDGSLFVVDRIGNQVLRWSHDETIPVVVAGGNGKGSALNQMADPIGLHITEDNALYITDHGNNRVVKWVLGSQTGSVAAGGHGPGNECHQLCLPCEVAVDDNVALRVLEYGGCRVSRWGPRQCLVWGRMDEG